MQGVHEDGRNAYCGTISWSIWRTLGPKSDSKVARNSASVPKTSSICTRARLTQELICPLTCVETISNLIQVYGSCADLLC